MDRQESIDRFLAVKSVAVVGASRDRSKYGNIVFRRLLGLGLRVYAVNPNAETVEGERAYPSLAGLPEKVEGAVLVVPPPETERVVREAVAAGIPAIWLQPGAESSEAIRYCESEGLCLIYDACILVAAGRLGARS
jgi:predicted CoA-binding protein